MRRLLALGLLALLSACGGGGNSSVTTINGVLAAGPVIATDFVQQVNNLRVVSDSGPAELGSAFSFPVANVLYADVTVCEPGVRTNCVKIDHVQVDTGSVGLRVLASKVKGLGLPQVPLDLYAVAGKPNPVAYECYPFVIGGLWGPNAVADVQLGQQWAGALPIQLIQDDPAALVGVPADCAAAANGQVLSSVTQLGSNGILGIGSVMLDCGLICQSGDYTGTYVQYYSCPVDATSSAQCQPAKVDAAHQVFNPVAKFDSDNNGVILSLPKVPGLGASKVSGELIFGINTRSNNQLAPGQTRVNLGVQWATNPDSYLNVTTRFNGVNIANSYLDTGTNALFFTDASLNLCSGSTWYCPGASSARSAVISDGDLPGTNPITVSFAVSSADAYFSTSNVAYGELAGVHEVSAKPSFAWGLPFFFGKRVYLSIWQQAGAIDGPWYAWSLL